MTTRSNSILRELVASGVPVTGSYLASLHQVSSRTVREDIKELQTTLQLHGAEIEAIKGKGYQLKIIDNDKFRAYVKEYLQPAAPDSQALPSLPEERVSYLIQRLLLASSFIKLDELANEMFVSRSTVQNDLKKVREILKEYNIALERTANDGLHLQGSEMRLRFCIAEYIFDRQNEQPRHDQSLPFLHLSEQERKSIWSIILRQIKIQHISLSDIALHNLFNHILIAYQRIQDEYYVSMYHAEFDELTQKREYQVAKNIVEEINQTWQVSFPEEEIAYITLHLLGTRLFDNEDDTVETVKNSLDSDTYDMVTFLLAHIDKELHLKLQHDQELIVALALHLQPAISRFRYNMNVRNPMLADIKANYPLAFEAGVVAGIALEEHYDIRIDENEIGYLALHIGAALERSKMETTPARCLIVCASGRGSAQLLYYRLQAKFGRRLHIQGTTEYYRLREMNFDHIDVIISSVPIYDDLPVPVLQVNTILSETDLRTIEGFISKEPAIRTYLRESLVFLHQPFSTTRQILTFFEQELSARHLIDDGFLDSVLERENVAATAFGNLVAIPHPVTPKTEETFLAFCTLDKPVRWGERPVQLVCLLNVKKDSTEDLQEMYELLGRVIEQPKLIQRLLKAETAEGFLQLLASS
ncbi:BglG family transcription antiterminator [Marinococcus halotolerans]|uniref:BglG family transcription antiterminator n=1 Tax=Marinococcus halotolerans TaxID=301092 RepID=UPI0003B582FA|nr:BglG family transcription antiterminator [Marinococcus halotolerans]